MAKEKLYIRMANGRYKEYKPIEPKTDNAYYRKIDGKYVPCGLYDTGRDLPEGIWAVTKLPFSKSYIRGDYMQKIYSLDHVCDIQSFTIAQLASLEPITHKLCNKINDIMRTEGTLYEKCAKIVALVVDSCKENRDK